ncbi:MAG: DUF89 family protein [Candidatus Omnitrophica bacterium]|nr:DUF89 family protein [Candidatus Omnitrophota bacterium]
MKTHLDCIPCFFRQALEAAKLAGADQRTQKKILNAVAEILPGFSLNASPPEMGRIMYRLIQEITGKSDPYADIKKKSNKSALALYRKLKKKIEHSHDRLLTAVELAIAGNIIDYGVKNTLNVDLELSRILKSEKRHIATENKLLFRYDAFKTTALSSRLILYLADNAGETVFDRILIEEIKRYNQNAGIIYAVKERPIINDALRDDALLCGIDREAEVISSGCDGPGTILSLCSRPFLRLYRKAEMIISKGQGNFEALSRAKMPIFFLFMAKCPVVAGDVGCRVGDIILLSNE